MNSKVSTTYVRYIRSVRIAVFRSFGAAHDQKLIQLFRNRLLRAKRMRIHADADPDPDLGIEVAVTAEF
jgi:hypothetical protein